MVFLGWWRAWEVVVFLVVVCRTVKVFGGILDIWIINSAKNCTVFNKIKCILVWFQQFLKTQVKERLRKCNDLHRGLGSHWKEGREFIYKWNDKGNKEETQGFQEQREGHKTIYIYNQPHEINWIRCVNFTEISYTYLHKYCTHTKNSLWKNSLWLCHRTWPAMHGLWWELLKN